MAAALVNLVKRTIDYENFTVDRLLVLLLKKNLLCHLFTKDEKCWRKLFPLGHNATAIQREFSGVFSEYLVQGKRRPQVCTVVGLEKQI